MNEMLCYPWTNHKLISDKRLRIIISQVICQQTVFYEYTADSY